MSEDEYTPFEIGAEIITSIPREESPQVGDVRAISRFGWGVLCHYQITRVKQTRLGWLVEGIIVPDGQVTCDNCQTEFEGMRCPYCWEMDGDVRAARMFVDLMNS